MTEIKEAAVGDICLAVKLTVGTSGTLAAAQDALPFVKLRLPEPVYSVALLCSDKKSEDKMAELIGKTAKEGRTISFGYRNVLSGTGELQINILLEQIRVQVKINVAASAPRIAYRETVERKTQAEYTHKKQSAGTCSTCAWCFRSNPCRTVGNTSSQTPYSTARFPKAIYRALKKA